MFDAGFDVNPQGGHSGDAPQGRDDITPEISVLAAGFFFAKRAGQLAEGVITQAGHSMVPPPPLEPFLTLHDPGQAVVASVHDLSDALATVTAAYAASPDAAMAAATAAGVAAAGAHAGVAEQLISALAAHDATVASTLQVARAWEVA